jgi:hypothetical protein
MLRFPRLALAQTIAVSIAALTGCDGSGGAAAPSERPSSPPITAASPSASANEPVERPEPPANPPRTRGRAADDCVEGWVTPLNGDPSFDAPLRALRRATGWSGKFVVFDMRMFVGSESPPDSEKGYLREVRRWYVKGYVRSDPALQGRFLIEERVFGVGLSAVAPFDSAGWESPDWSGFQFDSADPEPKQYPELPGEWSGIPYDFVEGGEDLEIPGLPADVVGCLEGT